MPLTVTYIITSLLWLRTMHVYTPTNNFKHHSTDIVGHVPMRHIWDAPNLSCLCACIPRYHQPLNSVCHMYSTTVVGQSRHTLLLMQFFRKNVWKYSCTSNELFSTLNLFAIKFHRKYHWQHGPYWLCPYVLKNSLESLLKKTTYIGTYEISRPPRPLAIPRQTPARFIPTSNGVPNT